MFKGGKCMEKYEKMTELLTDEELMELTGGFETSAKMINPFITVLYGVIPVWPILLYGIQPLYGIKIDKKNFLA